MELQFHERSPLDGLGFDVFDASDIEEVIFVIISEIAFHLGGIHPAVRLGDVDRRDAEGGKMSRDMRSMPIQAPSRLATTITMTVRGRRRAACTRFISASAIHPANGRRARQHPQFAPRLASKIRLRTRPRGAQRRIPGPRAIRCSKRREPYRVRNQ
jgi:hypothetical protein